MLGDIDNLVRMGAQHINFGDPDFLNGVKHSLGIVREMRNRHPELSFDFTAKIEHLIQHRDVVMELAALGCVFVLSAVEHVDDRILRYLDKGHTRDDVVTALEITRVADLALRPSLLPFTPWTTLSGYLELLEFVQSHDLVYHLDPVQYSIRLLLPPGSWLLDILRSSPTWRAWFRRTAYTHGSIPIPGWTCCNARSRESLKKQPTRVKTRQRPSTESRTLPSRQFLADRP